MIPDTPTVAPVLEPDDTTAVVLAFEEYSETPEFVDDAVDWAQGANPTDKATAALKTLCDEYASSLACAAVVQQHLDGDSQW